MCPAAPRVQRGTRHIARRWAKCHGATKPSFRAFEILLLHTKGKAFQVWPIREVQLTPAFPPFNESILATIRQWEYEPLVESQAVPWCVTVTVNIDLK
jgi:hypothetical protein